MAPLRYLVMLAAVTGLVTTSFAETPASHPATTYSASTAVEGTAPVVPTTVAGKDGVKGYLLGSLKKMNQAAADLKADATAYTALIAANGGTPESAANAKPAEMASTILKMRDAYGRIDSFGYEYIEGIVAGTPALMNFDVELDSGVPAKGATAEDQVAELKITAGNLVIDKEGSLNNWLIEATVYGTNPRFVQGSATLPGFDKRVNLPNPKLVTALADYAIPAYARLTKASEDWKPTDRDLFHVLASMTPTLADYFDEWKDSKKGTLAGGRFVAVTRVSDMRGIMSGTRLTWLALADQVKGKDDALAKKITAGYDRIMKFIDTIEERDKKSPLTVEAIDSLGTEAKDVANKLTVQCVQAAALMGINEPGK